MNPLAVHRTFPRLDHHEGIARPEDDGLVEVVTVPASLDDDFLVETSTDDLDLGVVGSVDAAVETFARIGLHLDDDSPGSFGDLDLLSVVLGLPTRRSVATLLDCIHEHDALQCDMCLSVGLSRPDSTPLGLALRRKCKHFRRKTRDGM